VYDLELASADGARTVTGTLVLGERAADMRDADGASTPLEGTLQIDLAAVGAQPVTGLESDDPAAPGVLVLERGSDAEPAITLRLGSTANRVDERAIDAAYTVLDLRRIGDGGFFGVWRSGVRLERSEGFFCAWPGGD
jgi:hypothetical protein